MDTSRSVADSRVTSSPPMKMEPELAISRPAIRRSVVVLPHPEGPSRVTRVPASMVKLMSATATTGPKALVTSWKRTASALLPMVTPLPP